MLQQLAVATSAQQVSCSPLKCTAQCSPLPSPPHNCSHTTHTQHTATATKQQLPAAPSSLRHRRVSLVQCCKLHSFAPQRSLRAAGSQQCCPRRRLASKTHTVQITHVQVVSDYLTPYDGEAAYLSAQNRPVAVYTYRMAFTRHSSACSGGGCTQIDAS